MSQDLSPDRVRRVLLGLEGPYADIRVATDALDNLAVLVEELDAGDRERLAKTLLVLAGDPDVVVASGAVLGLDPLREDTDPDAVLDAATADAPGLDRRPVGFGSIRHATVRAELLTRAARVSVPAQRPRWEAVLEDPPGAVPRSDVLFELAPRLPLLVLARARDWCTTDDVAVLTNLPTHWHRVAVAGALAPWPEAATAAVEQAGRWRDWADEDTEALLRAMTSADPVLNRPDGLDDPRRWWIVDGENWDWAVWQADAGALALEVLRSGPSMTSATRVLTADEVVAYRRDGIRALADLVVELRDG